MDYTEKIDLEKIRSFADLFSAAVNFTSQNVRLLIRTLAITSFPFILIAYLLLDPLFKKLLLSLGLVEAKTERIGYESPLQRMIPDFANGWEITSLLFFLIGSLMLTSTVLVVFRWYRDTDHLRNVSIRKLVGQSFLTAGNILLVSLIFIVIFAAFIILFMGGLEVAPELSALIMLPAFLIFTYVGIPMFLFFTVRTLEKTNIASTIQRSFHLQKSYWWSAVGLYFLAFMICYSLSVPVIMLSSASTYVVELFALQKMEFMTAFLILYKSIIFIVTNLFLMVVICFNYFNLVEMKDGNGMLRRIKEIGAAG